MKRRLTPFMIAALLTGCGQQRHGGKDQLKELINNTNSSDIRLGSGYNSASGAIGDTCIETSSGVTPEDPSASQTTWFSLHEIKSLESLQTYLNVSVSGSFNYGYSKGSAKVNYFNSLNMNQYTSYLLVSVRVENEVQKLNEYKLSPPALELLASDRNRFAEVCGDEFVSGMKTGGEFMAVVEFFSKSREEKERIDAAISASGGTWSFAAQFKKNIESISRYGTVNVEVFRQGGSGKLPDLTDLVDAALRFPEEVQAKEKSWTISWVTRPYTSILSSVNEKELPLSFKLSAAFLSDAAKTLYLARSKRADIQEVLLNADAFAVSKEELKDLQGAEQKLTHIINTYSERALACYNNQELACKWPPIEFPTLELPEWLGEGSIDHKICAAALRKAYLWEDISYREYVAFLKEGMAPYYNEPKNPASGIKAYAPCEYVRPYL